mmetsp:Transcript_37834/g.100074  ORF Transcript_37834/g.100074 Transcript_37834/m.100074 type:complete len:248 (+) Transcript_37834:233-976(+)
MIVLAREMELGTWKPPGSAGASESPCLASSALTNSRSNHSQSSSSSSSTSKLISPWLSTMYPTIRDRGKSHGCDPMNRSVVRSHLIPDSSSTSRNTHSSSVSPNSTKPASVDHRPSGHSLFLPSKHLSPLVTSMMTDGSRRGRNLVPHEVHWRLRPFLHGSVFPPQALQKGIERCQSAMPRAVAKSATSSSSVSRTSLPPRMAASPPPGPRVARSAVQRASSPRTGGSTRWDSSSSQNPGCVSSPPE